MPERTRVHCSYCQSELARTLPRGTLRVCLEHVGTVYALAGGALLLVCGCGRRNLVRAGRRALPVPADPPPASPARFGDNGQSMNAMPLNKERS